MPDGMRPTDAELVASALRGDRKAFDVLVGRHQRRATVVAYRLLGDVDDAQEVAQEAFLRAYHKLSALAKPGRFGAWLLRIVTNLALNRRRGRALRRMASLEGVAVGEPDERRPAALADRSTPSPEEAASAGELREAIRRAVDELPEKQRLALVLFSIEKLPQKDVAEMMNISVEAVKWHVFTARKKLKERFGDYL